MKIQLNKTAHQLIEVIDTKLDKEYLYFILHLINHFPKINEFGFVSLYSKFLQQYKRNYEIYLDFLLENKIIRCNGSYIVKKSALGYRIDTFNITTTDLIEIEISDFYISKDLRNDVVSKEIKERILDVYENKITVDQRIVEILNSVKLQKFYGESFGNISSHINKIINKQVKMENIANSKTGRVYHPFNEMMSNFRYYVLINNNRLWEIDCSNSQPFFLCILINNEDNTIFDNKDADLYKQLCIKGELYDYFLGEYRRILKDNEVTKLDIKLTLLQMFFSSEKNDKGNETRYRSKTRKVFKEIFPSIYSFVEKYKKDDFKELSCKLQELESNVFISEFNNLFEGDYLSAHDAVYVSEHEVKTVKSTLTTIFHNKYGIIPNLKFKECSEIKSVNKLIEKRKTRMNNKQAINKTYSK
jgi:hypothetical protein